MERKLSAHALTHCTLETIVAPYGRWVPTVLRGPVRGRAVPFSEPTVSQNIGAVLIWVNYIAALPRLPSEVGKSACSYRLAASGRMVIHFLGFLLIHRAKIDPGGTRGRPRIRETIWDRYGLRGQRHEYGSHAMNEGRHANHLRIAR